MAKFREYRFGPSVWSALAHGDGPGKAEVAYDLSDTWRLTLGANCPTARRKGPLGSLRAARRARLALRWSW